ncbi:MAG: AAA family ATPase, partial [Ktedonobacterales bacterium]
MILLQRLRVKALKHLRDIDLRFPQHGAILIEGQNESGKSTLFEAIYFALYGAPLVSEESRQSLQSLLPHSGGPAEVALNVRAGETELDIRRTLAPAASGRRPVHEAQLIVRSTNGQVETIATPAAVNTR